MKCRSCHADLQIDDEVCRYCDTVNPRFKKHRKNMQRYQTEFSYTKKVVYEKAKKQSNKSTAIISITILILINIALFILTESLWSIERALYNIEIEKSLDLHTENINTYIAEENYMDLYFYFEHHEIYRVDAFDNYQKVRYALEQYYSIYDRLLSYTTLENYYYDSGETAMKISYDLDFYYSFTTPGTYYDPDQFTPEFLELMQNVENEINVLLMTYANLDEEAISSLRELSDAERAILIERGLENEK